jgi:hypothetical protein
MKQANPLQGKTPKAQRRQGFVFAAWLRAFASLRLCVRAVQPNLQLIVLLCSLVTAAAAEPPSRTIGIEGRTSVVLPGKNYRPRPLDDRTELILRLESHSALTNGQHRYEFSYIGLEPGVYNLADYLMRPDGSRPDELGTVPIQVRSTLPENHDGQLNAYLPRPFPWIGGYRLFLVLLGVVWAGGIAGFAVAFRRKRVVVVAPPLPVPPSFAERLRPLVEAAAAGKLSADGQAHLERLMMGYWREKLQLPELPMAEALLRLKAHAQAGELLRALERWLHRQGSVPFSEVAAVLEPYRNAA